MIIPLMPAGFLANFRAAVVGGMRWREDINDKCF
jgi:hypothetical protein